MSLATGNGVLTFRTRSTATEASQEPDFFTDQYDLGMEYVGHADDWDQVVIRGDRVSRTFIAFWLKDRQVKAAMNVNVWDVADDLRKIILSDQRLDPAQLADSDIPLNQLIAR